MLGPILQWVNKIYQKTDVKTSSRASQESIDTLTVIKSVQRGTSHQGYTDQNEQDYQWTTSINSVDMNKSVVYFHYDGGPYDDEQGIPTIESCKLTSSNELSFRLYFETGAPSGHANQGPRMHYQVVEYK